MQREQNGKSTPDADRLLELRAFLARLQRVFGAQDTHHTDQEEARLALVAAECGLGDLLLRPAGLAPVQVAVLGPTQVGKSTVVNLLLGECRAIASPLAAYTERVHAFLPDDGTADGAIDWLNELVGSRLSIEPVAPGTASPRIVWDTPDFDSHRSRDYRDLIVRVAALADVFLVVVSKEKYADLSVWRMLALLMLLDRPLVICMNKSTADREPLLAAIRQRLVAEGWGAREVSVCALPYMSDPVEESLRQHVDTRQLIATVNQVAAGRDITARRRAIRALAGRYWSQWTDPVRRQLAATEAWEQTLDAGRNDTGNYYRERYLEQAANYEGFNRAVIQLLQLLEIPALAGPLTKIRAVLTWPLRKLITTARGRKETLAVDTEVAVLTDTLEYQLLHLHRVVIERGGTTVTAGIYMAPDVRWWRRVGEGYAARSEHLRMQFAAGIDRYQQAFEPEIEAAAQKLYQHLQRNPAALNTLRTARVVTDTAAILVAVKTGTVGLSEALLTPAMLSLTSFMTEGVVGKYMTTVRQELQALQFDRIQTLFDEYMFLPLSRLAEEIEGDDLFRVSAVELARMTAMAEEL